MNFLPQWILNRSARIFAFDYFKNVIKVNKKFKGSAWEKKVKENPEFYRFFKGKVDSYMGKWFYDVHAYYFEIFVNFIAIKSSWSNV